MKSRIYLAMILALAFSNSFGQMLYKDKVFNQVDVTSDIVYSTSNSTTLKLDVYEPHGDTAAMRPLLIMAHGGSFIGGTKTQDNVCTQLCDSFARRGYVTASIDYRLGGAFDMLDSAKAIDVVMKAISDGKAAIRFFRKDAATTNTYRINPDLVFVGGNSAGAVLYMHQIYIDSLGECPANLRTIINNNGGLEGNSGNPGYCSKSTAIMNLAGGLNVPEFVGPGNKPSFNAQGDQDATVPYNCANAQSGITPVRLCGLGVLEPLYNQYSINHSSIVYPGEGHVPWQSNAGELREIDSASADFFYSLIVAGATSDCDASVGINEVEQATATVFPNPTTDVVNIRSLQLISNILVYDQTGRLVKQINDVNSTTYTFNTTGLSKGVYSVKVDVGTKALAAVKRLIIE
jgi:hypothetical protein